MQTLEEKIFLFLQEREGRPVAVSTVSNMLRLERHQVMNALARLKKKGVIDRLGATMALVPLPVKVTRPEVNPKPNLPENNGSQSMFETVGSLGDGRVVLRDEDGNLRLFKEE